MCCGAAFQAKVTAMQTKNPAALTHQSRRTCLRGSYRKGGEKPSAPGVMAAGKMASSPKDGGWRASTATPNEGSTHKVVDGVTGEAHSEPPEGAPGRNVLLKRGPSRPRRCNRAWRWLRPRWLSFWWGGSPLLHHGLQSDLSIGKVAHCNLELVGHTAFSHLAHPPPGNAQVTPKRSGAATLKIQPCFKFHRQKFSSSETQSQAIPKPCLFMLC
jgi:hypothetical protein